MNIVKTGTIYRLFDKSVETCDTLPPIALEVCFSKFEGFYLKETDMPDLRGEKIYGDASEKVEKVLKNYNADKSKNMGVILSGQKGIGKTLFAKMTAIGAIGSGLPVIYVNDYFAGLPGFFRNITQDCVVIFDEFDKNFISNSKDDVDQTACQDGLLTMFDGIYGGHKLFIITCNEVDRLSDFYVNRPGRFRYHIRFGYPSQEEVNRYLQDKLGAHPDIDRIVRFTTLVPLSYDCLSAIAAELKMGESFKTAMAMLNIVNIDDDTEFDIYYSYKVNGRTIESTLEYREEIPLFADNGIEERPLRYAVKYHPEDALHSFYLGTIDFIPKEVRKYGNPGKNGSLSVDAAHYKFSPYDLETMDKDIKPNYVKVMKTFEPGVLSLKPSFRVPTKISYEHIL